MLNMEKRNARLVKHCVSTLDIIRSMIKKKRIFFYTTLCNFLLPYNTILK